ncbi:ABC transporter permease [Candidatus Formimonas warabiya]|uniref:ABC transmembrane type-1 domain-containing protein n=1 Tax=Formimonas warabiya TaxID=1761012 RepID=A0A3G1KQT0_FORW1|nr:ABC transporter permease [Candidatus Formimonas warabiya]ATW24832.1 hypothetical protein DCMF_08640 [Candidatus Formimonas warabiya]
MSDNRTARYFLTIPSIFLAAALFIPMIYMIILTFHSNSTGALSLENYQRFFADSYYLKDVLWISIKQGILSGILALILGYPVALYIAKTKNKNIKTLLLILSIVPLWVNVIIRVFGWRILLSDHGLINEALLTLGLIGSPIKFLATELGVLIGLVQITIPFIVLPLVGVLESMPTSLEEAAYSVGARPFRTFLSITFPLSMPGVMSGLLMSFALNAGGYAIPAMLGGGKVRMLAVVAYDQSMSVGNFNFAALLGLMLLVTCMLFIIPSIMLSNRLYYGKRKGSR